MAKSNQNLYREFLDAFHAGTPPSPDAMAAMAEVARTKLDRKPVGRPRRTLAQIRQSPWLKAALKVEARREQGETCAKARAEVLPNCKNSKRTLERYGRIAKPLFALHTIAKSGDATAASFNVVIESANAVVEAANATFRVRAD
ncbi:hypothetical protein NVV93_01970 [Pseudomonas sp. LS44]|uniref:hypothetical protein n=1 Tax=Pseudomonas sp. LS44 TaxID=1357074 RepID=UPI00215ADD74|nr:hypothetical protein [Pseudomonas sp. LS44]UVE18193.1 hypothetical protein NVV93_01970 [Pseudomonas sp. LS44]